MCRPRILLGLLFGLLLIPFTANAQSAQARMDSLRQVREDIAAHTARMHLADSIGDAKEAARWRIMLAPMCKRTEALRLYEEAALIADTADLDGDEELRARKGLVELYKAAGNWRKAFEEAERATALAVQFNGREAMQLVHLERMNTSAMVGERDFAMTTLTEERAKFEAELSLAEERSQRWMLIAASIGVLFLITLFVLFYRYGRANRRIRAELAALRTEVTVLKEQRPANQIRIAQPPVVPQAEPVIATTIAAVAEPASIAPVDPVVLAMFRKMAPERLATLRDARARGDHDKVVRVVRTLKPQLVAIDEAGFGDLCAAIAAEGAALDSARWNSDLDRFEQAVEHSLS